MKPLRSLPLVGRGLGAQAEDPRAEVPHLGVVVAKGAGLWRAAAGAGDLIPPPGQFPVRPPRKRVAVHHGGAGRRGEVDLVVGSRPQGYGRKVQTGQVVAGAVVRRLGQALWHRVDVAHARSRDTATLWPPTPRLAQRAARRSGTSRGSSTT